MNRKPYFKCVTITLGVLLGTLVACKSDENSEVKALGTQQASESQQNVVPPKNSVFKGKVRSAIGDCDIQKAGNDWNQIRIGQRVVENDRIRTALESEVVLGINDGSVISISELSEVSISAEMVDSLSKRVSVFVKNGNVYFDIQKQGKSQIDFRTGIATAAIRGTAGFVGSVNGNMVASLKEGRVEVTSEAGSSTEIVENQTVLLNKKGEAKKLKLKSSGTKALAKAIDSLVATPAANVVSEKALENTLQEFDRDYVGRQASFEKSLRFMASPIADSVFTPSVVLQARVTPGTIVTVLGESDVIPENGIYKREFSWDKAAYGTKRFLASCGDGVVEIPCFMWTTEYAQFVPQAQEEPAAEPVAEQPVTEQPVASSKSKAPKAETPKADAPKADVSKAETPKAEKSLKLKVAIAGKNSERIHLDLPKTAYTGNLKFSLKGISEDDLDELKSIQIRKGGAVVETIGANDLTSLDYDVPISVERNHIAEYEVVVSTKGGKNFRAKKTYEVFCLVSNHPGGKARNRIVDEDQEYERVKSQLVKD